MTVNDGTHMMQELQRQLDLRIGTLCYVYAMYTLLGKTVYRQVFENDWPDRKPKNYKQRLGGSQVTHREVPFGKPCMIITADAKGYGVDVLCGGQLYYVPWTNIYRAPPVENPRYNLR